MRRHTKFKNRLVKFRKFLMKYLVSFLRQYFQNTLSLTFWFRVPPVPPPPGQSDISRPQCHQPYQQHLVTPHRNSNYQKPVVLGSFYNLHHLPLPQHKQERDQYNKLYAHIHTTRFSLFIVITNQKFPSQQWHTNF